MTSTKIFRYTYYQAKVEDSSQMIRNSLQSRYIITRFSVFKQLQEFYDLSSDFNCIIDVFSVVELKMRVFSAFTKVALRVS